MDQLNAGSLFVEVGASTSKLDADLARAKKALDAFEAEDPTVAILAELSEKGEADTEQELKQLVSRLEQQTELEIEVSVDKKGEIAGAGKQIELFQSKLSKVLGIAAGLTAGVALFGGIAKGVRDAADSTGILADETTKAQGEFRAFAVSSVRAVCHRTRIFHVLRPLNVTRDTRSDACRIGAVTRSLNYRPMRG